LLVGYDGGSTGPLAAVSRSSGLLGGALVLSREARADAPRLRIDIVQGTAPPTTGALASLAAGNAMAPMLPLFEALARGEEAVTLHAGPGRALRIHIDHAAASAPAHDAIGEAMHG